MRARVIAQAGSWFNERYHEFSRHWLWGADRHCDYLGDDTSMTDIVERLRNADEPLLDDYRIVCEKHGFPNMLLEAADEI